MVEDYCALLGEEVPVSDSDLKDKIDDAVRHLYALLLQDLRPPWIDARGCQSESLFAAMLLELGSQDCEDGLWDRCGGEV